MKFKKAKHAADATALTVGTTARLILKIILTIFLIFLTTGVLFACIFAFYVKNNLSMDIDISLSDFTLNQTSTLWYTDENGDYQELSTLYGTENRIWVDGEEIPQYMKDAAIAIEDKRFKEHNGVDWYRTFAAFRNMFISNNSTFGGSTITQQLIKNLTDQDEVTVQRKLLEIFRALELEKNYSKDEIMAWYLNTIYLGEGCYGVYTAAETYFNKELKDLSLAECASIIAITNNPSLYDPFISTANNKERQEIILKEMYDQGLIEKDEYEAAKAEELVFVRSEDDSYEYEIYSYYEEAVIEDVIQDLMEEKGLSYSAAQRLLYTGGYQIYTCLDMDIQNKVDDIYTDLSALPQSYSSSSPQLQSAIVIIDPYTGDIVALSGGTGEKEANFILNRATDTTRPPGSSIKPLSAYGPAMELGLITQNTLVNDSANIRLSGTSWYPRNSGGGNRGVVTIKQALVSSLNTVAAQIIDKLTPETSYEFLTEKLGFTTLTEDDRNYAPLALGQFTNGATVREMAQAYTALANDGIYTESRTYTLVTDMDGNVIIDNESESSVAFSANTAWNITDMLSAAVSYGTGTEAKLSGMSTAGKTGTTTDDKDRWFVGYTPYYVAAVWTGYDTPAAMRFSGNPAAQIWKKVMTAVHEGLEDKAFPEPTIGSPTGIFNNTIVIEDDDDDDVKEENNTEKEPEEEPEEDPGTTDPGTTDPGTTDPGTTDPGTTDPGTTDPGTTDPGGTEGGGEPIDGT